MTEETPVILPLPPAPPLRRYGILAAAVLMTAALGATYSWSVYTQPLRALLGLDQEQVQWPFTVFYSVFPATTILAGLALNRLGPRRCAVLGGLLFGGGWMLAGLAGQPGPDGAPGGHFTWIVAGIGVLGGLGVGFAYIVPLATAILWFPRHKGLITGLAVAGFGGGAWLITHLARHLMSGGATPFTIFWVLGLIFLFIIVLTGLTMQKPPVTVGPQATPPVSRPSAWREPAFWKLYLAMFAGLAAGFTVVANLGTLYHGPLAGPLTGAAGQANKLNASAIELGAAAVGLFALANALGRIGWGFAFDRLRATTAIRANLILQALTFLLAFALLRRPAGYYLFAVLAGLNYGGVLVIYASATARRWGPEHLGPVYGWLFSANIPAAWAPKLAGRVYDRLDSFTLPLAVIGAFALIVALTFRLKDPPDALR